jgi:hypothetical protein
MGTDNSNHVGAFDSGWGCFHGFPGFSPGEFAQIIRDFQMSPIESR